MAGLLLSLASWLAVPAGARRAPPA
jgi:hypothetical protein